MKVWAGEQAGGGQAAPRSPAPAGRSPPAPVIALSDVYFFLIVPSSGSTRSFSCSLVLQFRTSWM